MSFNSALRAVKNKINVMLGSLVVLCFFLWQTKGACEQYYETKMGLLKLHKWMCGLNLKNIFY